jgi:hypothetical protein
VRRTRWLFGFFGGALLRALSKASGTQRETPEPD